MRIGQIARLAATSAGTLRYYERRGLLPRPERTESGYRSYPPQAVARVRLIRWAQEAGFTLREIRETFPPGGGHAAVQGDRLRARVELKLREIDARIAELEAMRMTLADLRVCRCNGDCPIVTRALLQPAVRPRKERTKPC